MIIREHFTDFGSLVLLSDGENGTPLVVKGSNC